MTIVADSGSTKTTWASVETGNKFVTEGLNPHFSSDQQVLEACAIVRQQFKIQDSKFKIYFYGAGCGNKQQAKRMKALLQQGFGTDNIIVETDMLGACRASADKQPALVGILGTGSNACIYDGNNIKYCKTSTGYIMGDFGSANDVGRVLLNVYLNHNMPSKLRSLFHSTYKLSDAQFMDAVYHQPNPNRFLASLAPFAIHNIEDDSAYCRRVIELTLMDWWYDTLISLYRKDDNLPLNVVGGYAKAIEPTLRIVMENNGLRIGTVLADPIDGLIDYHRLSKKS